MQIASSWKHHWSKLGFSRLQYFGIQFKSDFLTALGFLILMIVISENAFNLVALIKFWNQWEHNKNCTFSGSNKKRAWRCPDNLKIISVLRYMKSKTECWFCNSNILYRCVRSVRTSCMTYLIHSVQSSDRYPCLLLRLKKGWHDYNRFSWTCVQLRRDDQIRLPGKQPLIVDIDFVRISSAGFGDPRRAFNLIRFPSFIAYLTRLHYTHYSSRERWSVKRYSHTRDSTTVTFETTLKNCNFTLDRAPPELATGYFSILKNCSNRLRYSSSGF